MTDNLQGAITCPRSHYKGAIHPVHATNAEQCQMVTDPWTKPTDLSHRPACRQLGNYIYHCQIDQELKDAAA